MALPPPPLHRSKQGFESASLYTSTLPTQQINRIPGYTGHIPGVRVENDGIGYCFGKTSHHSMNHGSATKPMTSTQPDLERYYDRITSDAVLRRKESKHTLGHTPQSDRFRADHRPGSKVSRSEAIFKADNVPGYTGFVPLSREITGATRAVQGRLGIATHDRLQQQRRNHDDKLLEDRNGRQRLQTTESFQNPQLFSSHGVIDYNQSAEVPISTTTYSSTKGVMHGCTKYMPQSKWSSVGRQRGDWGRETSELVGAMRTSNQNFPTRPAFEAKPKRYAWKVDTSTVYVGVPGWKR